jgi:hypothetical protein
MDISMINILIPLNSVEYTADDGDVGCGDEWVPIDAGPLSRSFRYEAGVNGRIQVGGGLSFSVRIH